MTPIDRVIHKKLRLAGILIAAGLVMEALTLVWNHPLSFLAFLAAGVLLILIGMALYLWTIVSGTPLSAATASEVDGGSLQQAGSK